MKILFLIAGMFLLSAFSIGQVPTDSATTHQVINVLTTFYNNYITLGDYHIDSKTAVKRQDSLINKYCTQNLLNWLQSDAINEYEGDPFVNTNGGYDIRWLTTLLIARDSIDTNVFIVSFIGYKDVIAKIKLRIVRQSDGYKIDSIRV